MHLALLILHVAAGAIGLLLGGWVIWLSRDQPNADARGAVYHWTVLMVSLTAVGLVALMWPTLWWLVLLAALAYALAFTGYASARWHFNGWHAAYAHGLGGSYIALVTALLVVALTVDGPLTGIAAKFVWVVPTLLGTVLIRRWHRRLLRHHAGFASPMRRPSSTDRARGYLNR